MKNLIFFLLLSTITLLPSCKNAPSESTENAQEYLDTTQAKPAEVEAVKPTPEVRIAERHAKVVSKSTIPHQTQEGKQVLLDSDPAILHHDHEESDTMLTDPAGYYYLPVHWATFPGGEQALDEFLAKNLKYPAKALNEDIQGTVYAELYVDNQGQVINYKFPGKQLGFGLEEEVARVIKLMPRWNPGMYNSNQVQSKFILPVKFQIM